MSRFNPAAVLACVFALSTAALAQDVPSLDDLLDLPGAEQPAEAAPRQGPSGAPEHLQDPDQPGATGLDQIDTSIEEIGDVFVSSVRDMRSASQRLGEQLDAGIETQRIQRTILAKLEQVMAAAQQQPPPSDDSSDSSQSQSQRESGSQENVGQGQQQGEAQQASEGTDPAQDSGHAQPASAQPREIEETRREWGHLPARVREEVQEGLREHTSPIYRDLTEAYYRRLAEDQR